MAGFNKHEHLKGEKLIDELFSSGSSFSSFPFRVIWMKRERKDEEAPVRILFSIPKKNFPKAHDRNYIRRRIRESYRLNKEELLRLVDQDSGQQLILAWIYTGRDRLSFGEADGQVKRVLMQMIQRYENNPQ